MVIVESYNNVISPIPLSSVEPNVVLTVMPGQVFAYEGVKYKKAYELIRGSGAFSIYTMEITHSIFKILRPDGTFDFNICSKKDEYCLSDVSKIVDWLLTRI
ncbi:TPA: hypothetical protein EYP38_01035 [Candidatus Micrarchaeota archaeon]|nr:hypothetical protein [Candidatus Micrarchaeota archaeon]